MNLLAPYVGSCPTVARSKPKNAEIKPFAIDFPEIETMTERPKNASINISALVNFIAICATRGDKNVMISAPNTPPQNDENIAIDNALPA